ncbi:unnamed protein product [Alopecurus aequalis]
MGSSNLWLPQFGVDAMNGYFAASGGGMLGADVPPFHPSMTPPDHGGYGLGLCSGGATATAADINAQCTANNLMLASLASQLYASAPHAQRPSYGDHLGARTPPEEEMDGGYDRPYAALLAYHGKSEARAMAPCSISSSDSMASSTDQFSPGSAITHMSRAVHSSEQSQQAYRPQPQPRFWPVHFAVVVARSPYAPVAQRALNDAVGHVLRGVADVDPDSAVSGASSSSAVSSRDQSMASLEEYSHGHGGARWGEAQRVRSELLNMLQLMDEKYSQCLEEIQSTTAKFSGLMQPSGSSSSSGGGNGSICAPFAHRAVSSAYRALRRRITGEIMAAAGAAGWPSHQPHRAAESSMVSCVKMEQSSSWDESAFIQKHVGVRRRPPHQDWRPQRGLPEKSVSVLKAWLFENFLHPYPQDSEKDMLAARSGLTRNQVANWFINARVRLWKPLIVELHEELKRSSGGRDGPAPAPAMAQMSSQYVVG